MKTRGRSPASFVGWITVLVMVSIAAYWVSTRVSWIPSEGRKREVAQSARQRIPEVGQMSRAFPGAKIRVAYSTRDKSWKLHANADALAGRLEVAMVMGIEVDSQGRAVAGWSEPNRYLSYFHEDGVRVLVGGEVQDEHWQLFIGGDVTLEGLVDLVAKTERERQKREGIIVLPRG